ncbi:armadillo repeat-containing protein 1-like isoform X2 [Ambystoma mexicanum]
MNALSVVNHLRDLASDPQNREAIVKDAGCLPGLILFLDNSDSCVLRSALQALSYLSECPSNREAMKNELGMMVSLENLSNRCEVVDIKLLALDVWNVLSAPLRTGTARTPQNSHKPAQFFFASANKSTKTITLHVQGLDNVHNRNLCEEALCKVKGVISFTFQTAVRRCTVRVRADLATESLANAIAATKVLKAQQVIQNESGNEVYLPIEADGAHMEQNSHLPEYLAEEESPQKGIHQAVASNGSKGATSASWVNAAANFLAKSFYW